MATEATGQHRGLCPGCKVLSRRVRPEGQGTLARNLEPTRAPNLPPDLRNPQYW